MPRSTCALFALFVCAVLAIAGCGGGGGSSSTTPPDGSGNPTPSVASVTPSSATAGSTATGVTVAGSGFVSSSAIQWNGNAVATTFVSSSSLQATIPATDLADGTTAKLTVQNPAPGGGTSSAVSFTVNNPVPSITGVSPANALVGSAALRVTISGTGFVPSTVVTWNGASLTTTFISTTQLTTTLPAANLTIVSEATITAQNPAPSGGTSTGVKFDVKAAGPFIQSIAPRIVPPGSPATIVTLTGTGFTNASVVLWNSSPRPTTFVNATQLQVMLAAADLLSPQSGSLQVSNPGATSTLSAPVQLAVSSNPLPTIQSVTISSGPGLDQNCPKQLAVTITGGHLTSGTLIQANGIVLPTITYLPDPPPQVTDYLPVGFIAQPGQLFFIVSVIGSDGVGLTSDPYAYPTSAPPAIAICVNPTTASVYPSTNFRFSVLPSEVNVSGNATLKLGTLPAGITSSASSFAIPITGTSVRLTSTNTVATGPYKIPLTATFGTASGTNEFDFTVASGTPPGFSIIVNPIDNEVGVPIGGSASIDFGSIPSAGPGGVADYEVTPSVSTLPTGTTATFSPTTFVPGDAITVRLTAASNAPVQQNVSVTLTGTPSGSAPPATAQFFADVTQPPGSLANSRTDYVSTAGTPSSGTYDRVHNLIFVSNPDWNRVDVISNATHKIVKSVPIRGAISVDITQDNSRVWVQTMTPQVYAIDTTSLQATHYTLPTGGFPGAEPNLLDVQDRVLALSDGTLFIHFGYDGAEQDEVWNPQTNQLTILTTSQSGFPIRSGDGAHVFLIAGTSLSIYDVASKTNSSVSGVPRFSSIVSVNQDGSRLILTGVTSLNTMTLFDRNLNALGTVPGTISGLGIQTPLDGGTLFSSDGTKLFEIEQSLLLTINASTLQVVGTAPAAPIEPFFTSGAPDTATPFAVDSTGMILALQNFGVSFEDSTFFQNYGSLQPVGNGPGNLAPASGPLAGGTVINDFLGSTLIPDVWFGQTRGSITGDNGSTAVVSPSGVTPGPVNVKFIYPSGIQKFLPYTFTYSAAPEYSVTGGSPPAGGVPGRILGYGLPQDLNGGSLAIGGSAATITNQPNSNVFSGEPLPTTTLDFTIPAGTPGWSDLTVTTPAGTGTLPKSIFYAKSVNDYSSADTFSNLLVDEARHQVYVSAGDHIDVFSTTSNHFVSSLQPAAVGAQKQFTGMALTPDGSRLLVANFAEGSLAVINPDSPSTTFAIGGLPKGNSSGCALGPVYVAATSTGLAFVTIRGLPNCFAGPDTYTVNLQTRTAAEVTTGTCGGGQNVQATSDGNYVVLNGSPCIYVSQTGTYLTGAFPSLGFGITVSGDGNVIASGQFLGDLTGNLVGILPRPVALFGQPGSVTQPTPVFGTQLNASGSLYIAPFTNSLEITDVAHGRLRLRFAFPETVQSTSGPMAIDSAGRFIYLITDRGLTVIDMGAAILSIGHLSSTTAAAGSQVTVRGSGFDATVTATVGGTAANVSFTDENTLTLTIPTVGAGPHDIVLTRVSDGLTYTLENAVVVP